MLDDYLLATAGSALMFVGLEYGRHYLVDRAENTPSTELLRANAEPKRRQGMLLRAALQGVVVGDFAYTLTGQDSHATGRLLLLSTGWSFIFSGLIRLAVELPLAHQLWHQRAAQRTTEPETLVAAAAQPALNSALAGVIGAPSGAINVVAATVLAAAVRHVPLFNAANTQTLAMVQESLTSEMLLVAFCSSGIASLSLGFVRQQALSVSLQNAAVMGGVSAAVRGTMNLGSLARSRLIAPKYK